MGWSSEQAKAELMALKPDRRLSSGGAGQPSSAPSHTQRAAGGRRKQWDDNVAPPVPPRDERRSQLNPALPIHTKRATSHNTKPKGAFSSSVAEEYILAQKASALLEEEIARQAKLDAMVSQVTPPLGRDGAAERESELRCFSWWRPKARLVPQHTQQRVLTRPLTQARIGSRVGIAKQLLTLSVSVSHCLSLALNVSITQVKRSVDTGAGSAHFTAAIESLQQQLTDAIKAVVRSPYPLPWTFTVCFHGA